MLVRMFCSPCSISPSHFDNLLTWIFEPLAFQQVIVEVIRVIPNDRPPKVATEWLNRLVALTVEACLPVFQAEDVGCLYWGLVNGQTQTHLSWGRDRVRWHRPCINTTPITPISRHTPRRNWNGSVE